VVLRHPLRASSLVNGDGRRHGDGRRPIVSVLPLATLVVGAILFGVAGPPAVAQGADGEPRAEVVEITAAGLAAGIEFSEAWSYHPGDDPAWADPDFDDSEWPLVAPRLSTEDEALGDWPGIGWFRRRVRLAPDVTARIGIWIYQAGAAEVYLDGRVAARYGTVSAVADEEAGFIPQHIEPLDLEPGRVHVLAVRYSNSRGHDLGDGLRGFVFNLGELQALTLAGIQEVRRSTAFVAGWMGLFGAFTVLHLLLFVVRRKARENLFFALFTGAMLGLLASEMKISTLTDLDQALVYFNWFVTSTVAMALAAILLERWLFTRRVGATFWLFVAAGVALVLWTWTRPAFSDSTAFGVFVGAAFLETLRLAVGALRSRERDAWIIGAGFAAMTLGFFALVLVSMGWLKIPGLWIVIPGLGAVVLSFSLYLTRRVEHTHQELEAKLVEVEELTLRAIEQERLAAAEEAERRVLERDNRRKTRELEEARELQMSMLPRHLPELDSFDIAVHMSTAAEVGGDYYDFANGGSGSCTLAVGDATGHGVQAGMVVAVAKSLFQACSGEAALPDVLKRIGDGLGGMDRREASMAMLLLRLNGGHSLRLASAGMPPLLVWRYATGQVEEILLPNVPLGTLADIQFSERDVAFSTGDTALIMTDGLAELAGPDGDPLGYDQVSQLFAEAAQQEPEGVIESLLAAADTYREGTVLPDDVTLLVLKARG